MTQFSGIASSGRFVALCGGVGGAKLAVGLSRLLGERLTLVVNTGDDFEHLGLAISPDIDTVLYTLGRLANPVLGWGRSDETWSFMETLGALGGETWFRLGDRDLALHVERTHRLRAGMSLTEITRDFGRRLGIDARVLPMCDDPVRTVVETDRGPLPFQRYFVERRCEPIVRAVRFEGSTNARPSGEVLAALGSADLAGIILCPSNPFLSIDPILAAPGIREALLRTAAPIIAVSPIVGGAAVKGPTAKIMAELAIPSTSAAVARRYEGLVNAMVIDEADLADEAEITVPVLVTKTLMREDADKLRLAGEVIEWAVSLSVGSGRRRAAR